MDIGLKYQDEQGNAIDPHMNEREIATSRLDKLLGTNVIGEAKKAKITKNTALTGRQYHDDRKGIDRTFTAGDTQNRRGVLMEEVKGKAYNDYNWDFLGLSGEDNMNALVDTGDGSTIGERLAGGEYGELQKQHLQAVDHERTKTTGRVQYLPEGQGTTLNAMDPKLQRDMNALFLLDTLALQTDRHSDNFLIQADDQGQYLGLKGIDNDISFGEKEEAFGKKMNNYSGLPSSMLIDQGIADRVRAVSEKELKKTFSDLLTEGEIQALWVRFQKLSKYIDEMEEQNLLVPEWNDETAKKQLMMQTGVGGDAKDYYSRHLLALNMKSTKLRNV